MRYDSATDLILANGSVSGNFATFDIPGDNLGQLNNIMPSIDLSGNNDVLNGFSLYTPGNPTPQGTIVNYLFSTKSSTIVYLASVGGTVGANIAYSYDAIMWTPANIANGLYNGFASNTSMVLALGSSLLYSTNGVTWTVSSSAQDIIGDGIITAAAWNGSYWIAVGYNSSSTICVKSDDGISWTSVGNLTTLITHRINDIKYANGLWITGGAGANSVAHSVDGMAWYSSSSGNMIINAGSATSILYTRDRWFMGVTGGNEMACLAISYDGKLWLPSASAFEVLPSVTSLATNGSVIVATGNSVMYSKDAGVSWIVSTTISTIIPDQTISSVAWTGSSFLVGSSSGITATSPDGIQWSSLPPTTFSTGNPITGFATFTNTFGTLPCVEVQSTTPVTLTGNKTLYIKHAKTAMDSALTFFLQYVASLTTQGMLPNTTPGFQNQSYANKNLLPSNITEGGTFTIGTTTITPTLKGVYNPATSYELGDLVYYPDASGSLNMCLIGPDVRGPSYSHVTGAEPVEDPLTSPYWSVLINRGWNTWTYDSLIDLALNTTDISSNVIFCDSNLNVSDFDTYPANLAIQLGPTALQGFTLFGSGINQQTRISTLGYAMTSSGAVYALTLNKVPSPSSNPLYVKNGLANFLTLNTSAFANYLSLSLSSANTVLLNTTLQTTVEAVSSNSASLTVLTDAISTISTRYPSQTIVSYVYDIGDQLQMCISEYSVGLQIYENDVSLGNAVRIPLTRNNLLGITSTINAISSEVATAGSFIQLSDSTNAALSLSTITGYTDSIRRTNSLYNNIIIPSDIGYSVVTGVNYLQVFPNPLSALTLNGDFTVEWVTVNSLATDYNVNPPWEFSGIFQLGSSLNFSAYKSTWVNPLIGGGVIAGPNLSNPDATPPYLNYSIGSNQQNHFAWVRSGSNLKFYINGLSVYSATVPTTPIPGSNLAIGNSPGNGSPHWQGGLRNFRVDTTAIYTANFNTDSTITSFAESVFTSNLSPLSTTVVCLPMNQAVIFNDFSPLHSAVSTIGQQMSSTTLAYSTMITPFTQVPVGSGFMTIPPFPKNAAMVAWAYPETSVTATWLASAGATSYTVNFYYSTTNTTTGGTLLETVEATGEAATTTTAIANALFIYAVVCANNEVGSSIYVSTGNVYVDQPPTDVQISPWTSGETSMTATWTDAPNEISFTVSFYTNTTDSTSGGTLLQTITGVTGTSKASTSPLVYGKYYYATVFGVTNVGNTTTTTSTNAVQFLPLPLNPSAVTMPAVPANTNAITTTWTASSYSESYTVSFYTNPTNVVTGGTLVETLTDITGTTASTTAALTEAGYYYAVVSGVNSTGSSSPVSATAATFYTPACGPVTNAAVTPYTTGATSITVTWTTAPFATSYIVRFFTNSTNSTVGGSSFQLFNSVSGSATSQTTTTSITQGMYYYAEIQGINVNKNSETVRTSVIWAVAAPAAPTGVTMTTWATGNTTVRVSWTAATRATTYTVSFYSVATNTTTGGTLLQTITDISGTFCLTTTALAPGSYYYAIVTAVNTTGSSPTASSTNAAFYNPILPPPSTISVAINSLTLSSSWVASPDTYGIPTYTVAFYTNTTGFQTGGTLLRTIPDISSLTTETTFDALSYRNFYYATVVGSVPGLSSIATSTTTSAFFLPTPFVPTYINSLSYWFDAADDTSLVRSGVEVLGWTNKGLVTGSATPSDIMTIGSPMNSLNTVYLETGKFMTLPSYTGSVTGTSMFVVMKATYNLEPSTGYYPITNSSGPALDIVASSSNVFYSQNSGSVTYLNSNTTNLSTFTTPFILCSVQNGTTTLPSGLWNNGSNVARSTGTTSSSTTFTDLTLGSSSASGISFEVGEVIIYTSNLPYTHRQAVEGYLAWKWGLQTSLPNNHPFRTHTSLLCPLALPGLQMWLDATDPYATGQDLVDGANVVAWNDKSGKGRNATLQTTGAGTITSSESAINNLSAIHFNSPGGFGVRGNATVPSGTFSSNYTTFTVYKINSLTGQDAFLSLLSRTQTLYQQYGETRFVANNSVGDSSTNSNNWIATSNLNLNMLTTYVNYPGGSNIVFSENLNGLPLSLLQGGRYTVPSGTITDSTSLIHLTNINTTVNYSMIDIRYCEVLVFNYDLSYLQRQQVEGYLALKWGIQQDLPLYHPFKGASVGFLNPTSAPGLTLWLDASDPLGNGTVPASGVLPTWVDKSGKGLHATTTGTPQYNSNTKAISFNGSQFYSSIYRGAPTESAFMVVSFTNPGTTGNQYPLASAHTLRAVTLYSHSIYLQNQQGNNAAWTNPNGTANLTANSNLLFNYTHGNTSNTARIYANGTVGGNITGIFSPLADSTLSIGAFNGGGYGMTGTISELIMYNTALSTQDRQNIEGYLAWKWGLQSQLPAAHPYATEPRNLVYPNVNLTPPYPPMPMSQFPGVQVWLDGADPLGTGATATTTTTWYDKSGLGQNAVMSNTYGSAGGGILTASNTAQGQGMVVPLSTAGRALVPANTFLNAISYFIVYRSLTQGDEIPVSRGSQGNPWVGPFTTTFNAALYIAGADGVGNYYPFPSTYQPTTCILHMSIDQFKNKYSYSINGVGTNVATTPWTPSDPLNVLHFFDRILNGNINERGGCQFNGIVHEILVFNRAFSTEQRMAMEGYLASKWKLQSILPPIHSYKTLSPVVGPTYAFSPECLPNLQLWLDGSDPLATGVSPRTGFLVNTWYDKSGRMNHAVGSNSPSLTANGILFNGSNQSYVSPYTAGSAAETGFIIVNMTHPVNNCPFITGTSSNTSRQLWGQISGAFAFGNSSNANSYTNMNTANSYNTTYILSYTYNLSGFVVYENGVKIGESTSNLASFLGVGAGSSNQTVIGSSVPGNTVNGRVSWMFGTISEVIIYNSRIPSLQRQDIEGYLAWKWGINNKLQATHPHYYQPPENITSFNTAAPIAPQNLVLENAWGTGLSVSWTPNSNAEFYQFILNGSSMTPGVQTISNATFSGLTSDTSYTIQVVAKNSYGSASEFITASTTSNFNPTTFSGVQAWYDANDIMGNGTAIAHGTAISTWYDKSGNARNFIATGSPVVRNSVQNSLPGIYISGYTGQTPPQYYTSAIPVRTFASNMSWFAVYSHSTSCPNPIIVNRIITGTTWGNPMVYVGSNFYITGANSGPGTLFTTSYNTQNFTPSLLNMNLTQSPGTSFSGFTNGSPISFSGAGTFAAAGDSGDTLILGTIANRFNAGFNGFFHEVLVYNTPLTLAERQTVEGYLAWKWGLQNQLPPFHMYASVAPSSTTSLAGLPFPQTFPGLQLWLDAADPLGTGVVPDDGAILTYLADKSGNAYKTTFETRNSLLGVYYNNEALTIKPTGTYTAGTYPYVTPMTTAATGIMSRIPPTTFIGAMTVFVVYNSYANGQAPLFTRTISPGPGQVGNMGNPVDNQGTTFNIGSNNATTIGSGHSFYSPSISMQNVNINQRTGTFSIMSNGSSTYSSKFTTTPSDGGSLFSLFARGDVGSGFLPANLNEALVFNTVLRRKERQLMEGYLAWKWGIQSQLPVTHPYYYSAIYVMTELVLSGATPTTITLSWGGSVGMGAYYYGVNDVPVTPLEDNGLKNKSVTFGGLSTANDYNFSITYDGISGSGTVGFSITAADYLVASIGNPLLYLSASDYSGAGSWLDKSPNGNDADIEVGTIAKNAVGNGIVLNGSSYWVTPDLNVGSVWSFSVWYKNTTSTNGIPTYSCIFAQESTPVNVHNIIFGDAGNGYIEIGFMDGAAWRTHGSVSSYYTPNTWINTIATWNGTTLNIYINGTRIASTTPGGTSSAIGGGRYIIGNRFATTQAYRVIGQIGEIRVYNTALSATNVGILYNGTRNTFLT